MPKPGVDPDDEAIQDIEALLGDFDRSPIKANDGRNAEEAVERGKKAVPDLANILVNEQMDGKKVKDGTGVEANKQYLIVRCSACGTTVALPIADDATNEAFPEHYVPGTNNVCPGGELRRMTSTESGTLIRALRENFPGNFPVLQPVKAAVAA